MEIWKIASHHGIELPDYEVSSHGRVRRATGTNAGRLRKSSPNTGGYPILRLYVNGKKRSVLVHKMVAAAFLGESPKSHVVNHIDGNRTNNRVENLEYCTKAQNDIRRAGGLSLRYYFGNRKITSEQAERIRAILDERE